MNFAVLTYQYEPNPPNGIPLGWPSQVIELGNDTTLPGDGWVLMTAEALDAAKAANQSDYNTWAATHYAVSPTVAVGKMVDNAIIFGNSLINSIAVTNILAGITQTGKTKLFVDFCFSLAVYLKTGSLYAAIVEIDLMIADTSDLKASLSPFLTNTNLQSAKNKIQAYLGLALT